MRFFLLFFISLFAAISLEGQDLYFPREFRVSYDKGFRTKDGKPGENYFVNKASYTISVDFNPADGQLSGEEEIVYYNHSADSLSSLVFKLNQDYFKKGEARDFGANPEDLHDGVKIESMAVNGKSYTDKDIHRSQTLAVLSLDTPIAPHSTARISVRWQLSYPQKTTLRNGKYDTNTFFVGYWYPQIAVYDDIFGWDKIPYTGRQEFYNDHSDYEVSIRVPSPNVVWATGRIQNAAEVFSPAVVRRYEQALHSPEVVHIIAAGDTAENILSAQAYHTFKFLAKGVPDFSFATSDHYVWDASTLKLKNGKEVLIAAAYNEKNTLCDTVAAWARKAIAYFSGSVPAIPFPYPSMTVFNGGGAMEYPMMVNLTTVADECGLSYVLAHEIGHTYFPFAAGTNETVYSWMDEGLINYFPRYAARSIKRGCNYFKNMLDGYTGKAGQYYDMPMMVPANVAHDNRAYRQLSYSRPSFAFYQLTQYLGDSVFFAALRNFYSVWKGKHPYPYDFFFSFNTFTGQNLNWFWKAYFQDFSYPDLVIEKADYKDGKLFITLRNAGGMPVMTRVHLTFADGTRKTFTEPLTIWKDKTEVQLVYATDKPKEIIIGDELNPDKYPADNSYSFPSGSKIPR